MKRYLIPITIVLLLAPLSLQAQQLSGMVKDLTTGEGLPFVFIENHSAHSSAGTDASGAYTIGAQPGDTLHFHLTGYLPATLIVSSLDSRNVMMRQQAIGIDTVVIRPDLTQYQQDSLARRAIYGKKVDERPEKFKVAKRDPLYGGAGEGTFRMDAPLSSLIRKRTRKYKRLKAFQERYQKGEEQAFADSRYTPALVSELTGLPDDSASLFMNRYPVGYDFVRTATEMELKMWIRYNYRMWRRKEDPESGK